MKSIVANEILKPGKYIFPIMTNLIKHNMCLISAAYHYSTIDQILLAIIHLGMSAITSDNCCPKAKSTT